MPITYESEVRKEALDFLTEHDDMVVEAVAEGSEWDRNEIRELDSSFHENVTDRAYTSEDALWVIQNCESEETDRGLWEGQELESALQTKAAFSFSHDVFGACESLYDEIKDKVEEAMGGIDFNVEGLDEEDVPERIGDHRVRLIYKDDVGKEMVFVALDDWDIFVGVHVQDRNGVWSEASVDGGKLIAPAAQLSAIVKAVAKVAIEENDSLVDSDIEKAIRKAAASKELRRLAVESQPSKVAPGSEEERRLLTRWLRMSEEVGMRGGYPLGSSYIDARCGVGYGQLNQLEYVRFDNELGSRLTHLRGQDSGSVRAYLKQTFEDRQLDSAEDVLAAVRDMIRDRAPAQEFYEILDDVERVLSPAPRP